MLEEFKGFILRGRVVDLAVGIVVGVAFAGLVNSLVANLLTPLLAIPGDVDFQELAFTINKSKFRYGLFVNDALSFLIVAASVFFLVVRPINTLNAKASGGKGPTKVCGECLSTIPEPARRCAFCTSEQ